MNNSPKVNLFNNPNSKPQPPTKPPIPNQNQNKPSNSGAPLLKKDISTANSTRINAQRRHRENAYFRQQPIDNYFTDLLRLLRDDQTALRVQAEIASSHQLKRWVREGLDEFDPKSNKDRDYESEYKEKPFLRLSPQEVGFGRVILQPSPHSQKIEKVIAKVVEFLSEQLNTSKWVLVKILRKLAKQGNFYPGLYQSQIDNDVLKPNSKIIDRFFQADLTTVNQANYDYQMLITQTIELYFAQFFACLMSLAQFLQLQLTEKGHNNPVRRGVPGLITTEEFGRPLGCIFWDTYTRLSNDLLNPSIPKEQKDSLEIIGLRRKCKQVIFARKIKIFTHFVRLFQRAANEQESIVRGARQRENFIENMIKKLDKDIIDLQKSQKLVSLHVSLLVRQITELFLVLFPWQLCFEEGRGLHEGIKQLVCKSESGPLRPVRVVLGLQEERQKLLVEINGDLERGEWPVHSYHWKRWLGLLLRQFSDKSGQLSLYPLVLKHVVWLCKTVLREENHLFWQIVNNQEQETNRNNRNNFYLREIETLLVKSLGGERRDLGFTICLPILTASMGTLSKNHLFDTLAFIQQVNPETLTLYIKQHLSSALGLQERANEKDSRFVYSSGEKERDIQQQVKFLCRAVKLGIHQLGRVQELIISQGEQFNGFSLVLMLLRLFQRLSPEQLQDLKCLRYLVQALDSVFVNSDTRSMLPVALGAVENGKWSCGRVIRQIIDVCMHPNGPAETARQAGKLRLTFALHTNNILKVSNSIDEYFPASSKRQDEKAYEKLEQYIKAKQYHRVRIQFLQTERLPLRAVPWLHSFLLILEGQMRSIDLQNVCQLLLKMRVGSWSRRQFANLQVIKGILNNCKIPQIISDSLRPTIINTHPSSDTNKSKISKQNDQKIYLFGLANSRFEGFVAKSPITQTKPLGPIGAQSYRLALGVVGKSKYASKQYCQAKQRQQRENQQEQIYGMISSSLRVIETVLRLHLQGEFQLLKKLKLTEWVIESLTAQGYFYQMQFTVKVERMLGKGLQTKQRSKQVQYQDRGLKASINLLHTVVSLLDFEQQFSIDQYSHPSVRTRLPGVYYLDIATIGSNQRLDSTVVSRAQLNFLCDPPVKDTISISVLQIIQHLLLLGFQKQTYLAITNRVYPRDKSSNSSPSAHKVLDQLALALMRLLSRPTSSVRIREVTLDFLSVCLRSGRFADFVKEKAFNFREPLVTCLALMNAEGGISMLVRLLLVLNLILSNNPRPDDLRLVKSCFGQVGQFGKNLSHIVKTKLRDFRPPPYQEFGQNLYASLLWSKRAYQITMCKMALLLYLAILSALLCTESLYSAASLAQWVIGESQIFIIRNENVSAIQVQKLGIEGASRIIQQTLVRHHQQGYLQFTDAMREWLALGVQGSLGEDFVCRRWEVYQRAIARNDQRAPALVLHSLLLNLRYSLHLTQEALSQYYYTVLLGLFVRGSHGYYFIDGKQQYSQQFSHCLTLNGQHSPNCLSGFDLVIKNEDWPRRFFILMKDSVQQIWSFVEQDGKGSRNSGILVVSYILRAINEFYQKNPTTSRAFDTDSIRIANKIEANLWSSKRRLGDEKTVIALISGILKISFSVYIKDIVNSSSTDSIRNFLSTLAQNYENVCLKLEKQSIIKLGLLVIELEIQVLLKLQTNIKQLRYYLTCREHAFFNEQIKQGLDISLKILQDSTSTEGLCCLAIQMFSKTLQISYLSQEHGGNQSIIRPILYRLYARLQVLAKDQGQDERPLGVFIVGMLSEGAGSRPEDWGRGVARILQAGQVLKRVGKCGSTQTLWQTIQAKLVLSALVRVQNVQTWRNKEVGPVLINLFVLLQQNVQRFQINRITPNTSTEIQIAGRRVLEDLNQHQSFRSLQSIFGVVAQLSQHQMLRNFLLFLLSALKNCPLLIQLCEKTITSGPLEEHTWERIKITLDHAGQFMVRFCVRLRVNCKEIVTLNSAVCQQASFSSMPLRMFFQSYENQQDLLSDSIQTIYIYIQCVIALVINWRSFDWKSRIDWKPSRKSLVTRSIQVANRWIDLAKGIKCQNLLREKIGLLNDLLGECQDFE